MITVYGIKNCDTCRKALKWLVAEGIKHRFHDFRIDGLDASSLSVWIEVVGWEKLLNRRGTTWRNLPQEDKDGIEEEKAKVLMANNPTLIKRPLFEAGSAILVGFSSDQQAALKA
jgi:arsenate reductase